MADYKWCVFGYSYIRYVRETFRPVLTEEVEKVLVKYYQKQRRSSHENKGSGCIFSQLRLNINPIIFSLLVARTTIRMLESLIRLAQGELSAQQSLFALLIIFLMLQHMQD